jgi:hypothetical protein
MVRLAALLFLSFSLTAAPRPHPRLQVDEKLLAQIRALRDAHDPLWTRMQKFTTTQGNKAQPQAVVLSNMLVYLVSQDSDAFDRAWQFVRGKIYRNKTDATAGVMPLLELYKDKHQAAFIGGDFIGVMAHFYDWGYDKLSPAERKDLAQWLVDACSFTWLENQSSHAYLRNDGASAAFGLASTAYALQGDTPDADKVMSWFRTDWSEILKGLDIMGQGGATGEGNAYGAAPTSYHFIQAANVAYFAGDDLFASHVWFRKRLMYDAFAAYPGVLGGPDAVVRNPMQPIIEEASIGGDGRRALSWHSIALRGPGQILARRFAGTEEADTWNWVYRQPAVDRAVDDGQAYQDLLFYYPRPRLTKPSRLSYFDPSMGYVYIRSDWNSPDATWIAFWAGKHIDTHQHLDQGAFVVFKRRDLAPKTGHYDNDDVKSSHDLAYYTRTVSSNGILIGDPKEVFRAFIAGFGCNENGKGDRIKSPDASEELCIPNDGGQRTMSPKGLAVGNAGNFAANPEIWDVAQVKSFSDDGEAVAVVADITNAYNNPRYSTPGNTAKVNRVYRRLVYLRPADLLLIADTVESTNAAYEKKWLLHALDRIEVGGDVHDVRAGESIHTRTDQLKIIVDDTDKSDKRQVTFDLRKGYAALLMKTLSPADFRYRIVGGREPADTPDIDLYASHRNAGHFHRHIADFWVRDFSEGVLPGHKSENWAPAFPIESYAQEYIPTYEPGYGRWRVELEPATQAKTDYFLNALMPTVDPKAVMPAMDRVDTADSFGAVVHRGGRDYRVVFNKDTLDAPKMTVR